MLNAKYSAASVMGGLLFCWDLDCFTSCHILHHALRRYVKRTALVNVRPVGGHLKLSAD